MSKQKTGAMVQNKPVSIERAKEPKAENPGTGSREEPPKVEKTPHAVPEYPVEAVSELRKAIEKGLRPSETCRQHYERLYPEVKGRPDLDLFTIAFRETLKRKASLTPNP